MAVLLPGFLEDVLGCDEAVGDEPPEPVGNVEYVVVLLLLVHGGHDLVELGADGGVIPSPPVQESVFARCRRVEVVRAPDCHDAFVVRDQCLGNAMGAQRRDD